MSRLVLATADTEFEDRVRDAFDGELTGPLCYWRDALLEDPDPLVAEMTEPGTEVVALGPDLPEEASLALARAFDRDRPDISVVIVAKPTEQFLQSALRSGARDVVAPDSPPQALRDALDRAFEAAANRRMAFDADEVEIDTPRVVISLCPKGGAGKTTVSTNLALGLAHAAPGEVVIIDLDLQFGDVSSALGLNPEHSFADAIRDFEKLDAPALKAYLTPHPTGLFVLCAPATPTEADDLTPEHVERVVSLLAESFRYVVIDTPSGLDEITLAALELASDLVLLSATDVPSVRSTRKEIDALKVIGKPSQQWHFVLNRADARTGLTVGAIETAVGVKVDVAIPSSRSVPVSLNKGEPVLGSDPRSPVSLAITQLVSRLTPDTGDANGNGKSSGFFRKKGAR
jgi:pilus assembly protein CpaE